MADIQIGPAVRAIRLKRGLTQEKLAFRIDSQKTYIWKVEAGKVNPGMDMIVRLSEALNIEPWKLLRKACRMQAELEKPATQAVA